MTKIKKVTFKDFKYTDVYNPEQKKPKNRTYSYVIDGEGKEKLCVIEEIEINDDNKDEGQ